MNAMFSWAQRYLWGECRTQEMPEAPSHNSATGTQAPRPNLFCTWTQAPAGCTTGQPLLGGAEQWAAGKPSPEDSEG